MTDFHTMRLPVERHRLAPDGADARLLISTDGGGLAHFEIGPAEVSNAVVHASVTEIWYFLAGRGQMWRSSEAGESIEPVEAGSCLSIPPRTRFQFRSFGYVPLAMLVSTMPRWPGREEGSFTEGPWQPTLPRG